MEFYTIKINGDELMKIILKKLQKSVFTVLKIALYIITMAVFMLVFAIENKAVLILSRTMGITISTFIVVGLLFLSAYGKYDVGRRKSKPIVYSLALTSIFTDLITYMQLMIMNTITPSVYAFRLTSLRLLALVIIIQLAIIILFTYGGNALYFYLNDPESCCIVISDKKGLNEFIRAILKYKKQYRIDNIVDYRSPDLERAVLKADTVFMYNLPLTVRGKIINLCYENLKNIYFNPEISDIVEINAENYILDDVSFINSNVKELSPEQRFVKRLLDIVLSLIGIVLSSPIWLVSAIMIKAYDGGSILFKQKRATLHGKEFEVYKFRTMKENVENRSVTADDDRITPPGRILRKIRMDELPQLLNILRGDMSFVGPRPEMLENVNAYTEELPEFKYRLRAKAGLTGYAQIAGKYNTTPKDKLMMDMMYIENYSIIKDVQLLFQTVIVLLKSDSTEAFNAEEELKDLPFHEEAGKE